MKENLELEQSDLRIDSDMEVDCDTGQQITAYVETWFDAEKKFANLTDMSDVDWVNMYAKYNPFEDTLFIECEACRESSNTYFDYVPTIDEARLIKAMIADEIERAYGQTPVEFCNAATESEMSMEVMA